jgi:hypothetical protein
MGKEMKITKATPEIYHLENHGGFTPFTDVSLSKHGSLFFMNRGTVCLFVNGEKRDEALKLMHDMGIKVIDERVKSND